MNEPTDPAKINPLDLPGKVLRMIRALDRDRTTRVDPELALNVGALASRLITAELLSLTLLQVLEDVNANREFRVHCGALKDLVELTATEGRKHLSKA